MQKIITQSSDFKYYYKGKLFVEERLTTLVGPKTWKLMLKISDVEFEKTGIFK